MQMACNQKRRSCRGEEREERATGVEGESKRDTDSRGMKRGGAYGAGGGERNWWKRETESNRGETGGSNKGLKGSV